MTGKDLLLAMSRIDRKYVHEAEFDPILKKAHTGKKILLAAVVILLAAGALYLILKR